MSAIQKRHSFETIMRVNLYVCTRFFRVLMTHSRNDLINKTEFATQVGEKKKKYALKFGVLISMLGNFMI